jgi:hypothetical protein
MSAAPLGFAFSDGISITALVVSLAAVVGGYYFGLRQAVTSRQANQIAALVDLFAEHRSETLTKGRAFVCGDGIASCDLKAGLDGVPSEYRRAVVELMWFYDNLGVLVAHGIVDLDPIAGYLGGSLVNSWTALAQLVEVERQTREGGWQEYFENLNMLVMEKGPAKARTQLKLWRL